MYAMELLKGKEMGRISRVFWRKIETAQARSKTSKLLRYLIPADTQEQQKFEITGVQNFWHPIAGYKLSRQTMAGIQK